MVAPQNILSILTGGAWMLVNRTTYINGTLHEDPDRALGLKPFGIILYHPTGYMSAVMASTNSSQRPMDITYPYDKSDPIADWALVGQHSLCYSGPFSFTGRNAGELQGELSHGPLTMANVPKFVGSEQLRNFTLKRERGDGAWMMNLTIVNFRDGTSNEGNLEWRRTG